MLVAAAALLSTSAPMLSMAQSAKGAVSAALPRELGKPESELSLDIKAYQVDGLPEASAQALAAVTAPYVGTGKGYEDLFNAAADVTRYMQRELGYYAGFAYVPVQSPAGGVVHLQAVEGRLDQVVVEAPAGDAQLQALVAQQLGAIQPGSILRTSEVERAVLLLNDLRGWRFKVEISEGRTLGTASLRVTPSPEPVWSGRVEADTLGNRYTGLARLSGSALWSNPFKQGDALTAQLLSSHTGGLKQASAGYTLPLGAQGFKLGATVSRVEYGLDKDDYPVGYTGSVGVLGGFALYPVVRSRNLNVFALLSYEHKQFDDRQASLFLHKFSNDWMAGVVADSRDSLWGGGINTYEIQALQGRMTFGPFTNMLGLRRDFNRVTLGYSRLQGLMPGRLQAYVRYKGQFSGTSLDASERYAAGGPLGVRAFAPGEAAADTAHVVNAELRWLPPESLLGPVARELVFNAFYDWAHVRFFHDAALQSFGVANTGTLSGAGLGVIWDRPNVASVRLDLAWRGAGEALSDPKNHLPRANVVLTKRF
jgi:hemolysin activation/secretion protein